MRILLVEDDRKAAQILANGLEEEGFVIDVAGSGEEGDDLARINDYDLIRQRRGRRGGRRSWARPDTQRAPTG
jgi:DNA-binding NtrC family response regulator